ncbi:uncharacterized protein C8orf88 homolog isoform X2 [Paralichthys olivaceus]|uniref:uncharacterized protein C8orf88 homolog isoform X2 n=2 Tax=Paralichthys olivaceus TaxID=8255 RepID=UPI00375218A5
MGSLCELTPVRGAAGGAGGAHSRSPENLQCGRFKTSLNLRGTRMEVSRRRVFQKHLEPARPLRRCYSIDIEPNTNGATCAQALMEEVDPPTNIGIEQFLKIVNLQKQKEGRISYTRDFLIALASCPHSRKKPKFLPEHPIVLTEAREPGNLSLHEMRLTRGKEEMAAERLLSP